MTPPNVLVIARDVLEPGRSSLNGWTGRLWKNGRTVGKTLERDDKLIAPGVYPLRSHDSANFHRRVILIDVPDRRFIEFHEVNYVDQLLGCVGVGRDDLPGAAIGHSKPLIDWLEWGKGDQDGWHGILGDLDAGIPWWVEVCEPPAGVRPQVAAPRFTT